ncbi:unnamed protein product [Wuchereria bancrofti]|nr:unnamed protein product [Wuchereria bancrofti]
MKEWLLGRAGRRKIFRKQFACDERCSAKQYLLQTGKEIGDRPHKPPSFCLSVYNLFVQRKIDQGASHFKDHLYVSLKYSRPALSVVILSVTYARTLLPVQTKFGGFRHKSRVILHYK